MVKRGYKVVQDGGKRGKRKSTVGEFAPFVYGKSLPKSKRNPSGHIPVFGSNGIVGYHDTALTDGPAVVIGRKGTAGAIHYSPVPCWPIDTTFFITDASLMLLRFKYYALKTLNLEQMNADSAVPGLNRDAAHIRELQVPEKAEQRAIAHILGTLDDKIELNRRMNETLEAMARALFKSWFIDFDPVRAKMAGCDPGLPKAIADLFPNRLVPSPLGEIPEGWEVMPIGHLAHLKGGKQLAKTEFKVSGCIPVFGGAGKMGFTDKHNATGYVITVGRVGAYCGKFYAYYGDAWVNNNATLITPKNNTSGEWLYLALRELDMESIKKGAAQPFVSNSDLARLQTIVAPAEVFKVFQNMVKLLLVKLEQNDSETATLARIRDSLLPRLISGELKVKNTDQSFQEKI